MCELFKDLKSQDYHLDSLFGTKFKDNVSNENIDQQS